MTSPTGQGPQDAAPGQPWPAWPQQHGAVGASDTGASLDRDVAPAAASPAPTAPTAPTVPDGPNWALAALGLLLLAVAGGQLAHLLGYRTDTSLQLGPQALIATGAVLVLVGAVGLIGRRTGAARRRRRRATTCR